MSTTVPTRHDAADINFGKSMLTWLGRMVIGFERASSIRAFGIWMARRLHNLYAMKVLKVMKKYWKQEKMIEVLPEDRLSKFEEAGVVGK